MHLLCTGNVVTFGNSTAKGILREVGTKGQIVTVNDNCPIVIMDWIERGHRRT